MLVLSMEVKLRPLLLYHRQHMACLVDIPDDIGPYLFLQLDMVLEFASGFAQRKGKQKRLGGNFQCSSSSSATADLCWALRSSGGGVISAILALLPIGSITGAHRVDYDELSSTRSHLLHLRQLWFRLR